MKVKGNQKKGFTLVELLSVIVILAVILIIAAPKMMSVIQDSRKATLESTTKMIASAAEKAKVENDLLGDTGEITCESVVKLNNQDYESCSIKFNEKGEAIVTIVGSGKFEGISVCEGTKTSAGSVEGQCNSNYPTLISGPEFLELANVEMRAMVSKIDFYDSYELTGDELELFDMSESQDRSIMAYGIQKETGVEVIVVGNGSGGILLNPDSSSIFALFSNISTIGGMEILDWSNVTNSDYIFAASGITSVNLKNIKSIGEHAFDSCINLESITLPNSVTRIGQHSFRDCSSLTSIVIPNSVTSIGYESFKGCTSLISIVIPNSVASIEGSVFSDCSSLTSVVIPNSVTSIDDFAFSDCTSLTSIVIPNSVTSIEDSVFSGCTSLTSIVIPNSVASIGYASFENCTSLKNITLPNSVTSIENSVFSGCTSLTSVVIPNNVTSIDIGAFDDCSKLKDVYYTGTSVEWNNILIGNYNDYLIKATKHYEHVVD